jgi:hypothetical protein
MAFADGREVAPLQKQDSDAKSDLTEEQRIAELGKPRLGTPTVIACHIRESTEFKVLAVKLNFIFFLLSATLSLAKLGGRSKRLA